MRIYVALSLLFVISFVNGQSVDIPARSLIVIFDGLRPDYITADKMPNVFAFKERGCYVPENHSVFPTVTRVNASSYATGSYPATHGLMGNTVYFPEVEKLRGLNTGEVAELTRIQEQTGGRLLTSLSLGELLQQQAGSRMMVFSSGSSGQAFLQNHTISGGGIINPGVILPASLKGDSEKIMGPPPPSAKPNTAQHEWATRALIHYGFADQGPLVSAIWFSDPDGTAHSEGMGAPLSWESVRVVDQQFGNILQALNEKDLIDSFNIIVTADHGFVTNAGTENVAEFLIAQGLKKDAASGDVVVAGNAIYVKDHNASVIKEIVSTLQAQPWIGAIFTKSADGQTQNGWVEGTLSFETIHWDHATRTADILVDYNWDDRRNAYGIAGRSYAKGVAGHGGSSPYEIRIPLIASGPGFRKAYVSNLPSSNTDIVPTILHLLGLKIPPKMDGRVLSELLAGYEEKTIEPARKEIVEVRSDHHWGTYTLTLERSIVGKQQYVNYTKVERQPRLQRK